MSYESHTKSAFEIRLRMLSKANFVCSSNIYILANIKQIHSAYCGRYGRGEMLRYVRLRYVPLAMFTLRPFVGEVTGEVLCLHYVPLKSIKSILTVIMVMKIHITRGTWTRVVQCYTTINSGSCLRAQFTDMWTAELSESTAHWYVNSWAVPKAQLTDVNSWAVWEHSSLICEQLSWLRAQLTDMWAAELSESTAHWYVNSWAVW